MRAAPPRGPKCTGRMTPSEHHVRIRPHQRTRSVRERKPAAHMYTISIRMIEHGDPPPEMGAPRFLHSGPAIAIAEPGFREAAQQRPIHSLRAAVAGRCIQLISVCRQKLPAHRSVGSVHHTTYGVLGQRPSLRSHSPAQNTTSQAAAAVNRIPPSCSSPALRCLTAPEDQLDVFH